ncbi:hypothetical protein [Salinivibrio costicola]|uniref:hypothetical protein n=1 Tax=Salinivibrio costicola TaxID=51367 RepID=UPI003F6E7CC8
MNTLETAEVQEIYMQFEELSDELIEAFAVLRVVQHIVQDVPQFDRGEKLPDVIEPTPKPFSLFQTLNACVKPQAVFQAEKICPSVTLVSCSFKPQSASTSTLPSWWKNKAS